MWPMTRGRAALLEVLQITKARYVATRCRVTTSSVYHWASGRWRPSPEARRLLAANYGIPEGSWSPRDGVTRS